MEINHRLAGWGGRDTLGQDTPAPCRVSTLRENDFELQFPNYLAINNQDLGEIVINPLNCFGLTPGQSLGSWQIRNYIRTLAPPRISISVFDSDAR